MGSVDLHTEKATKYAVKLFPNLDVLKASAAASEREPPLHLGAMAGCSSPVARTGSISREYFVIQNRLE